MHIYTLSFLSFKKYWLSFVDCKSDKLVVEIWKTSMMEIRQWKPLISTPQRHSHFGVFWPLPLSLNVYVIYYISHYVPSPNLFHLISHHTSHFKRECMGPTCGALQQKKGNLGESKIIILYLWIYIYSISLIFLDHWFHARYC